MQTAVMREKKLRPRPTNSNFRVPRATSWAFCKSPELSDRRQGAKLSNSLEGPLKSAGAARVGQLNANYSSMANETSL